MVKLTFDEFKNEIRKGLEGSGYDVKEENVVKNNISYTGFMLSKGTMQSEQLSPIIYMEPYYEKYEEVFPLVTPNGFLEFITEIYEEAMQEATENLDPVKLNFEEIKNKITFEIINAEKNKELLKKVPHCFFLDGYFAVIFRVHLSLNKEENTSFVISNFLIETWGKKLPDATEELFYLAKANTPKLLPMKFSSMAEVMIDSFCEQSDNEDEFNQFVQSVHSTERRNGNPPMFVLTNRFRLYGASTLLYPGLLKKIKEKLQDDFFILPSSIHELIILPYSLELEEKFLLDMVKEVNDTEVSEEDFLAEAVFAYADGKLKKIC